MAVNFCQQCGHAMEAKTIEGREVPTCPKCGFTAWRNPLVATMVVVETSGGIVLGRRAIEPGYGLWCLPGGFVNEDEAPEEAAVRDCQEEIAARDDIGALLGVYHIVRGDGPGMVGIAYRATLNPNDSPSVWNETLDVGPFSSDAAAERCGPARVRRSGGACIRARRRNPVRGGGRRRRLGEPAGARGSAWARGPDAGGCPPRRYPRGAVDHRLDGEQVADL